MITFRTVVLLGGKTATGLPVREDVVAQLGGGRRAAVTVTLNGDYTFRSTFGTMGGEVLIPLSAQHRNGSSVAAGDEVEVRLSLDDSPRDVEVPVALAAALDATPGASARFAALSPSARKRRVLAIESARTDATREKRLAAVLEQLRGA